LAQPILTGRPQPIHAHFPVVGRRSQSISVVWKPDWAAFEIRDFSPKIPTTREGEVS
jgi:hypothetical protein